MAETLFGARPGVKAPKALAAMTGLFLPLLLLLAACGQQRDRAWLGYGEGEDVFMAAPSPGWVEQVAVIRGQSVKKGDLLFRLDDTRERAARDQALAALVSVRAQISQNQATLAYTTRALSRQGRLVLANAGAQDALDLARS